MEAPRGRLPEKRNAGTRPAAKPYASQAVYTSPAEGCQRGGEREVSGDRNRLFSVPQSSSSTAVMPWTSSR